MLVIRFFILMIMMSFVLSEINHKHQHEHEDEIGIALGYVPDHGSDGGNLGIHLHYVKGFGNHNQVGIGISLETIIDEHRHDSFSLISTYHFDNGFTIAYAPGILFVEHGGEEEVELTQHVEFYYEFELDHFHVGPQFDIGFEDGKKHYMLGLHFGIDI